jgi:hypothetical protein
VRAAVMKVLSLHADEICATDYELLNDAIASYAARHATARPGEDPRDRVWLGAWSSHKRHRPDCDCKSRMRRGRVSGKWSERCLRHYKRRRKKLFELEILVVRKRSVKGGLLKAIGNRRARGNAHEVWFGPEVEAAIEKVMHANRGVPEPPPLHIAGMPEVEAPASPRMFPRFTSPTRSTPPAAAPFSGPRWQLHGAHCTCESCYTQRVQQLSGHDPPEAGRP